MAGFTMQEGGLEWLDYVIFGVLCALSCTGGLWYSAISSKMKKIVDIKDYLLGGKQMSTFPVAMSLIASYISGVTILGTPAEIFNYGSQYFLVIVGATLSCVAVAIVYLPVFCTLQLSSSYEYLELRFNRHVRAIASVLFLFDEVLFLPMVVYIPALSFNQLTGYNVFVIGGVMVVVCGLYTVLGGLRAVVWTDAAQTGLMYLGVVVVAIAGTVAVGGMATVFEKCNASGRLNLDNWDFCPYVRQTGWGSVVGGFVYWTCFNSVNQTMVQRYIALPSQKKAIIALFLFCFGAVFTVVLCVWCGLVTWAAWVLGGCDQRGTPPVDDRLLPAFVTYVSRTQNVPGLAGVFLAGIFGAGLSSLSVILNACALVVLEDIMHGWLRVHLKPMHEGLMARAITFVLAVVSVVMLAVVEKLGGVLGVATALSAIASSATCGVFTLGMLCWWVGPRGALAGAAAGAMMSGGVSLGTQAAAASGLRAPPMKFAHQCPSNMTWPVDTFNPETIFPLFRVSYHWVAPLGLVATLVVGAVVGWLFDKKENITMDAELYSPVVFYLLPARAREHAGDIRRKRAETATPDAVPVKVPTAEKNKPKPEPSS